jgi:hypothetical protein
MHEKDTYFLVKEASRDSNSNAARKSHLPASHDFKEKKKVVCHHSQIYFLELVIFHYVVGVFILEQSRYFF